VIRNFRGDTPSRLRTGANKPRAATGFFVEAQTNADFRTTGSPILQRSDVRATSTRDIPVRTAAQRIGDAPAVLLRNYAKRKRSQEADKKLAETINSIAAGFLGT